MDLNMCFGLSLKKEHISIALRLGAKIMNSARFRLGKPEDIFTDALAAQEAEEAVIAHRFTETGQRRVLEWKRQTCCNIIQKYSDHWKHEAGVKTFICFRLKCRSAGIDHDPEARQDKNGS